MRTLGLALWTLAGCSTKDEVRPVANAGTDQVIVAGTSAALDGSSSEDAGGSIEEFSWAMVSLPSGSLGGLVSPEDATPALATDLPGSYVISLVVTDDQGNASAPDVIEVVAVVPGASRPEALLDARGDLGVGLTLSLDGSRSTAPEGREISSWEYAVVSAPEGATAGIDAGGKDWKASFMPDVSGTWIIGLTVADEEASSRQATVVLPVEIFPDLAPVARCGSDQVAPTGSLVELDGTDSFDPEGASLSYAWSLEGPERSEAALARADTANPRFVADVKGDYTATLVVSDGALSSEPCTTLAAVSKNPKNQPPVAFAGGAQSVGLAGSTVTLDGTGSFDPDGDVIVHSWSILSVPVGSSLAESDIADADLSTATFVPDAGGTFVIGLEVCDEAPLCAEDTAEITVGNTGDNQAPDANAGEDVATEVGIAATVDGSGSSDPDGDPLTFSWTIDTQPTGSTAIIEDADQPEATIQPDVDGLYVLRLTVDDGMATDSDLVQIDAVPEGTNLAPVCEEQEDVTVDLGEVILLDGSDTTDPNGDDLTFLWTVLSAPSGSTIGADDPTAEVTALRPDLPGEYLVQFQAMDGLDNCFFQFLITVEDTAPNNPPTCDGGGDVTVYVGDVATLDGSGSSDVDGDPLTFAWVLVDSTGGSVSIIDSTSAVASMTPEVAGVYTVELTVSDGEDSCSTGVVVTAEEFVENDPPLCRVSADSIVEVGGDASLDASATSDPDGDELSYAWTILSGPEGASSSFADESAVATTWSADTAGSYQLQLEVSDGIESCTELFDIDVTEVLNNPPECDAGPDITAAVDEEVALDARGTTDPDDDPMTFFWGVIERPEGSTAVITDQTLRLASFTPDVAGTYTIRFYANDGTDSCQDDMVLTVEESNSPPECDAGPDITAEVGEEVPLDARGTTDPDDDPMTFFWGVFERPEGSTAVISDQTLRLASFTPDVAGTYTIRFYADDGTDSCQDEMVLTVEESNNPPECNAGPDLTAEVGEEVALDARGTTDPDGDPMTFQWRVIARPEGSTAVISDLTLRLASFTPDVAGTFTIRFYADDGTDSCQDDMVLTVTDSVTNTPPVADAGSPVTLCSADTVDVDGSGSSDADGDSLSYSWSFASVPAGSSITDADLSGASSALASFTPDVAGTYVAELTVDDGTTTDTDTVTINLDGDDAVLLLHLDETSGTSVEDGSPGGLDGTLTGGTWSGGRFFGALGFDGGTWVTVPDDDSLDITDDFTIDWWMRTDDVDSTWQAVLTKGTSYNYSIWTYQDEVYFYGVTTSLGYVNAGGAASIGDGQWHHYAVTVFGGVITVYEDGVVLDSASYPGTLRTTPDDLHLGRPDYSTAIYMFEGALDEVTIRDRTLASSEIIALADADTQVCTGDEDTAAPTATVTSPGGSADIGFVRVEGTASDASAIVDISVDGAQAAATGENFSSWVAYVPLAEGSNTLVVRAEDVAGNVNSSAGSVTVTYEDTCGDDTVLLLAFDEETGGTAEDWSEGGHDATETSTGRVIGRHGNALQLDGSGSAQVAHDASLSLADAFSIETWYRQDTASAAAEFIVHKGEPANYGMGTWGGFLLFGFSDTTGADINVYTTTSFADGAWHHVVGVFDGSDLSLYVDGSLEATESAGGARPTTNSSPISIGAYTGAAMHFTGEIDQLRIYDDTLSTSEVVDLFADGEACPLGDNLSAGATATASTTLNPLFTAENTVDGNTQEAGEFDYSMWLTQNGETGWIELDFGEVVGVLGVRWANTHNRTFFNRSTASYRIIASTSRAFESEGVVIDSGTGTLETDLVFHTANPSSPVAARYLRIYVDGFDGLGGGINEIEVYGLD